MISGPITAWLLVAALGAPDEAPAPAPPPPGDAPAAGDAPQPVDEPRADAPVQRFEPSDVSLPEQAAAPPAPAAANAPATANAPLTPQTMDDIPVSSGASRVTLNIFGDVAFAIDSVAPRRPAFVLGPLDLLLFGHYGNLSALAETALETGPDGSLGIDLERMFVRWRTDRLVIDAGRTHSELGYWNNAFHHGRWLQMTVDRPRAVLFEDEGGILPVHWVGLTARWHLLAGDHEIDLVGAAGNGRGNIVDDVHVADDTNLFKSLLLKLEGKGFGARDLRVGISALYDRIAHAPGSIRPALPDQTIGEVITNAYVAYRGTDLTILSEAFDVIHIVGDARWATYDAFLLASYRFGAVAPYAMGELRGGRIQQDPFFFPDPANPSPELLGRFVEATAGLRWDISTWSALKLEYRATFIEETSTRIQRGMLDWTFGM